MLFSVILLLFSFPFVNTFLFSFIPLSAPKSFPFLFRWCRVSRARVSCVLIKIRVRTAMLLLNPRYVDSIAYVIEYNTTPRIART